MSTPELSRSRLSLVLLVGGLSGAVAIVTFWLALRSSGSDAAQSMAKGALIGGGVATPLMLLAVWRAHRRPDRASASERIVAGRADERDRLVWRRSTSILGIFSVPLTIVAAVAASLGAPVDAVMALLLWSQLILLIVAVLVVNRRS